MMARLPLAERESHGCPLGPPGCRARDRTQLCQLISPASTPRCQEAVIDDHEMPEAYDYHFIKN